MNNMCNIYREIMFERGELGDEDHVFGTTWSQKTLQGWETLSKEEEYAAGLTMQCQKRGYTRWMTRGRTRFSVSYWSIGGVN